MKVIISVGGAFHSFPLALQLFKKGFLERFITSYPIFKINEPGLPKEKIISLPVKEALQKISSNMPWLSRCFDYQAFVNNIFDKQASRHIGECDIFVGSSGSSLKCLLKAKALGAVTIIERNSAHIQFQEGLMKEEYRLLGLRPAKPSLGIIEKELKEYSAADYICVPSSFAKKTFLDKGFPEAKIMQIPLGVDTQIFRPFPKNDNIFRIIFVGALSVRKGVYYLMQAVSELKLKNLELCLIGGMHPEFRSLFNKYRAYCKYLGPVNFNQLSKYYSQGSVFVLPSIEDGFAKVFLQAMACGLPVISTTNSAGPDIITEGKDGFIIPIRDVRALKEKLSYLYENGEAGRQMGLAARERVLNGYTWDHYGAKVMGIYSNLPKEKRYA